MSKKISNLNELEDFLNQKKVFDFFGISRMGVFGSFARGEQANDIDLLVKGAELNKKGLARFLFGLEQDAGTKIDFVLEEYADPIVLSRAQKDLRYVRKRK
ncbi:MAG: hypothetical protein HOA17_08845 [Candidatus Melainabacteria bacterium]|jgi:uncharacterized protein|nr:hypothetical protein [Candidatus Melainabacteria bacterium]